MMGPRIGFLLLAGLLLPACGATGGGGTLTPTVAPAIPENLQAFGGNGSVSLAWTSPDVGSTFHLRRSLTSGGPYFPIGQPVTTTTSFVDPGLTNGTDYYYVVSASNRFGSSADSAEARGSPGFTPIAVASGCGAQHSLAILPDRTVWSWGSDFSGSLGRGTTIGDSGVPVQVTGLTEAAAVAAGTIHSLAVRSDGTVWAWGSNDYGQLGQGAVSGVSNPVPLQAPGLTGFIAVAGGREHSLALHGDGTVWSWGANTAAQLGNGTTGPPIPTPNPIPGLSNIVDISAGDGHNMALRNDGSVWVWGSNFYGERGNGTSGVGPVLSPAQVPNLTGIRAVSAGLGYCLALRGDGTVWGWGKNDFAQLGTGAVTGSPITTPVPVSTLTEVTAVVAGTAHAYALRNDGTVWGWGTNFDGEQGNGVRANFSTLSPVRIAALSGVAAVAAGRSHGIALRAGGTVLAWGDNTKGQVGNGTSRVHSIATPILNLTHVVQVAPSMGFALARRSDGTVRGWGTNAAGQMGNGSTSATPVVTPVQVPGLTGVTAISSGSGFCLALLGDQTVRAWGLNTFGTVGNNSATNPITTPTTVLTLAGPVLTGVIAISAGTSHCLAIRGDSSVWGWGSNSLDKLGLAGGGQRNGAVQVPGLTGVVAVAAGGDHSFALLGDGTVRAWGWNGQGEMGQGSASSTIHAPVLVPGLSGVTAIASGRHHGMALLAGRVWAWGANHFGEAGGTANPVASPTLVAGLDQVTAISGGGDHSLALRTDGTVWAWGHGGSGALGTDGSAPQGTPAPTLNVTNPASASAGTGFSLAIRPDGQVLGWGNNQNSELARPYLPQVLLPAPITQ